MKKSEVEFDKLKCILQTLDQQENNTNVHIEIKNY